MALSIEKVLEGVAPGWDALIDKTALAGALTYIQPDLQRLAPKAPLILESLRYFPPELTRIVIIGQDPYPTEGHAMGLSFGSYIGVPPSLVNIYAALKTSGLMRPEHDTSGDLRPWAAQGVLLLNRALTTRVGLANAHQTQWQPFTQRLIEGLCESAHARGTRLIFMLWGGKAQSLRGVVKKWGHHLKERIHPSPTSNNRLAPADKFDQCRHFIEANAELKAIGGREVVWDIRAPTLAFTDGACSGNGTDRADASYGIYVGNGPVGGTTIIGRVEPYEYRFINADRPEIGFEPDYDMELRASNNRGEYLAWCWCLLALLRGRATGHVEVVSDCNLFIQTMEEWLPTRQAKGTAAKGTAAKLKNYDLVQIGDMYLRMLRRQAGQVTLTHVNASHDVPRPPPEAPARDRVLWAGNNKIDLLAGAHLKETPDDDYAVYVETYSPALRHLC